MHLWLIQEGAKHFHGVEFRIFLPPLVLPQRHLAEVFPTIRVDGRVSFLGPSAGPLRVSLVQPSVEGVPGNTPLYQETASTPSWCVVVLVFPQRLFFFEVV